MITPPQAHLLCVRVPTGCSGRATTRPYNRGEDAVHTITDLGLFACFTCDDYGQEITAPLGRESTATYGKGYERREIANPQVAGKDSMIPLDVFPDPSHTRASTTHVVLSLPPPAEQGSLPTVTRRSGTRWGAPPSKTLPKMV